MVDDGERITHFGQFRQNVGGDQHRFAHVLERAQNPLHLRSGARVHAGGRLIQDEQARIVDERPCQAKPLLHSAGKDVHIAVALVGEVHQLQQAVRHAPAFLLAKAVAAHIEVQVFPGLQPVVNAEEVRHIAHQAANFARMARDVHAVQRSRPFGRFEKRSQNAHGGGFSRAVGTYKAVKLAVMDGQAQMVKRQKGPVVTRKPVKNQHHSTLPSMMIVGISMSA